MDMNNRIRRASQAVALQCLYSITSRYPEDKEATNESVESIIAHSQSETKIRDEELSEEYVRTIMDGVTKHQEKLANLIEPFLSPGWTLDRIAKVVQIILFMAAYEILHSDVKHSTIINDYLEIAKAFNHKGEVGFINSVLDKVAKSGAKTILMKKS